MRVTDHLKNKCLSAAVIFLAFLLAVFFFLPCGMAGQGPGYMGKKTVLAYGFNFSPAFIGATPNGGYFNFIHELNIDYAVNTKWQIGLSARFYKTAYGNEIALSKERVRPQESYLINGTTLALNFKYYKGNYVAPWGSYILISPVINFVSTSYDAYMHVPGEVLGHDTLFTDFGPEKQSFAHPDLMFGFGKTRIIADRVVIDWGLNLQLVSCVALITDILKRDITFYTYENYIAETHGERVHGINRFNLFIKLGYLF